MRRTDISATSQMPAARSITAQVSQVIHYPDHYRPTEVLGRIEDLLESLPLATPDYDLATARIRSAGRYYSAGETGAAAYELRLLCGQLGIPRPASASDFQIGDSGPTEQHESDAGASSLGSTVWSVMRQIPRIVMFLPLLVFLPVYALAWFAYWIHPEAEESADEAKTQQWETDSITITPEAQAWLHEMEDFDRF